MTRKGEGLQQTALDFHHLDLGRILSDQGKSDSARVELQAAIDVPIREYNDAHYRAEASAAMTTLAP